MECAIFSAYATGRPHFFVAKMKCATALCVEQRTSEPETYSGEHKLTRNTACEPETLVNWEYVGLLEVDFVVVAA